jgi:hypothetical protein
MVRFSGLCGHVANPAWVSWMADLVPIRIRGRYFSRRKQVGMFVGAIVTIGVGVLLDKAELMSVDYFLKVVSLLLELVTLVNSFGFTYLMY